MSDEIDDYRGPKERAYDDLVSPMMAQVIALCKEHKINMAAQFALDPNEEGNALFCTTCLHDVDPDDEDGKERMGKLRAIMFPPSPYFAAFTIVTSKADR